MIGCCGGWWGASALVDTLVDLDTLGALVGLGALVPPIWWIWMHCSALVGQVAITDSNMGAHHPPIARSCDDDDDDDADDDDDDDDLMFKSGRLNCHNALSSVSLLSTRPKTSELQIAHGTETPKTSESHIALKPKN